MTNMANCKTGPLEELTELIGIIYLSDLPSMPYDRIRKQLRKINPDDYTLFQWQDATKYLTGKKTELKTVREIYDYLLKY